MAATRNIQIQYLKKHKGRDVAVKEKHTLNGANTVALMKHKQRYATLQEHAHGTTTVAIIFSTVVCCCGMLQVDRFIKCMGAWEATKDQGSSGLKTTRGQNL